MLLSDIISRTVFNFTEEDIQMKTQTWYKSIQLAVMLIITAICLFLVLSDQNLYHAVANDSSIRILCVMLWAALLISFLFIFFDFKYFLTYRKDYSEMDYSVRSDPVSGISNRFSCDMLIEQYLDMPLPKDMACITFVITNMQDINRVYGHRAGNTLIRDFSMILRMTAQGVCFVGRNGGNNFLAIFEEGSQESIASMLSILEKKIEAHNSVDSALPIRYAYGVAFHETEADAATITDLIALSNRRIPK